MCPGISYTDAFGLHGYEIIGFSYLHRTVNCSLIEVLFLPKRHGINAANRDPFQMRPQRFRSCGLEVKRDRAEISYIVVIECTNIMMRSRCCGHANAGSKCILPHILSNIARMIAIECPDKFHVASIYFTGNLHGILKVIGRIGEPLRVGIILAFA